MDLLEHQVLLALREGSESAFEMLFKTYYRPLCVYAHSFLNDKEEAEEVVQSAFLSIWDKRHSIEIQTSTKSYLYRMVRNGCLNVIKHVKVKTQHANASKAAGEPIDGESAHPVMTGELEQRIHSAMESLPDQCRLVFQLSRFEELKYSEIAEQLNISIKTVENHMGKALRIMRTQLKEYLPLFLIWIANQ